MLASLRASLCGERVEEQLLRDMERHEWVEFVRLAQQHNVLPLLCDALAPHKGAMPREVFARLAGMTLVAEDKFEQREGVIRRLAALLRKELIPLMILKGYGISRYYPIPAHRTFSDVDIYNCGRIEEADRVIARELGIEIDEGVHHHTKCVMDGVLVENHYDFINTSAHTSNLRFERLLKEEAERGVGEIEVGGERVLLPSATFNALFLMRHMAHHYAAERVSLRHLCDWKQFVEAEHTNVDWRRVGEIYEQFNMKRFADVVNALCTTHLGMAEGIVGSVRRDAALENRIFNDILYAEFDEAMPKRGALKIVWWKVRRYAANRWKHRLIYNESWLRTFFHSAIGHLRKPHTITH